MLNFKVFFLRIHIFILNNAAIFQTAFRITLEIFFNTILSATQGNLSFYVIIKSHILETKCHIIQLYHFIFLSNSSYEIFFIVAIKEKSKT